MNFIELDKQLRQLDEEEKLFKELSDKSSKNFIESTIRKVYSISRSEEKWIINSSKLMKENENFSIHKHKRFVSFGEHKHDYIELIYVYSGEINQRISGKEIKIKKGELCILDMNVVHSIEMASEDDIAINIIMTGDFFNSMFMSFLSENDIMSKFIIKTFYHKKENSQFLMFNSSKNELVQIIMKRLLWEYYNKKVSYEPAIHAYILLLFTEFLREYKETMGNTKANDLNEVVIKEVNKYLLKNYKDADLKSTAEFFHFNPDYLSKFIKNSTGKSFTTLLQDIKLKESCNLLKNSSFTIQEIMQYVGYSNLSYFYKLFKKKFNVTPVEYRNKN
ncbi:AraC family transcriptional regulator [Clostridium grantii]|uniref:AraC-type DNA-binding protein n=1 Tax=Clostridium grantii DSM 8605 TaxID=1121316 RepID=A0A1M5XS73_9CLOT|nr:AraC family transcriptional regulator [Clostridium grantii]SHI02616.1 AraC-type DNA-binding protein [Clostridium grantii DSM 8605]